MSRRPPGMLPPLNGKIEDVLNWMSSTGAIYGRNGQHIRSETGRPWRIVQGQESDSSLLIQVKGLDPSNRRPKWTTVSRFGADATAQTNASPQGTVPTMVAPFTASGITYVWMNDGTVQLYGFVTINGGTTGAQFASGLPAPRVAEVFQIPVNSGPPFASGTVYINTSGNAYVTFPGGSTIFGVSGVRYLPASAYDMQANAAEPQ